MYIISPWLVYLVESLPRIALLFGLLGIITFVVFLIKCYNEDEKGNIHMHLKYPKVFLLIIVLCISLSFLTPTKETGYRVLIASVLTTDNLQAGHDLVASDLTGMLDHITESIQKIIETAKK